MIKIIKSICFKTIISSYIKINYRQFDWYQGKSNPNIIVAISKHSLDKVYLFTAGELRSDYNTLLTPTHNQHEYILKGDGDWLYRFDEYIPKKSMRFWIDRITNVKQWNPQIMYSINP